MPPTPPRRRPGFFPCGVDPPGGALRITGRPRPWGPADVIGHPKVCMHAVAAGRHGEVARPEWMFARAQPQSRASRSGRGVDARPGDRQNDPVTPRPAPGRHAASTGASHSDQLIRLLYAEHAGPLLMFVMRLTGGDRQRAGNIVQETLLRAWRNAQRLGIRARARCGRGWSPWPDASPSTSTAASRPARQRHTTGTSPGSPRRTAPTGCCAPRRWPTSDLVGTPAPGSDTARRRSGMSGPADRHPEGRSPRRPAAIRAARTAAATPTDAAGTRWPVAAGEGAAGHRRVHGVARHGVGT